MKFPWPKQYELEKVQAFGDVGMLKHLGIELIELKSHSLVGRMPVDHRTHQPMGLLHGGASVVLAESLASIGGNLMVDNSTHYCVGQEINANHVKSLREGWVQGEAWAEHIGKGTQVWSFRLTNPLNGDLVCIGRMTLAVLSKSR